MDWRGRPWDDLGCGGNSNGKRADVKLIDLDNLQSGTPYMADGLPCGGQQLLQKAIDYRLPPHILWAALKA
jgi:N-acyl-D-aspartate/D-glutamate deacylase